MLFMQRRKAPEPEDLRCEYRTSEVHIANLSSGVWQSAAIVVGGFIAALAVLLGAPDRRPVAVGVAVFAFVAIVIIAMWRYNWSRHKFFIDCRWVRMREIERATGMSTNVTLFRLTRRTHEREFPQPPGSQALKLLGQRRISEFVSKHFPPRLCPHCGQDVLHGTALLVQLGWILMAVFKLVDACCE